MRHIYFLLFLLIPFTAQSQWVMINQDSNLMMNEVAFLNADTGFVVAEEYWFGTDEIILRTTDGGQSWDATSFPSGWWMTSLAIASDSVVYAGGQDGSILKTTDGGTTWNYFSTLPGFLNDYFELYFFSADTGLAVDYMGHIFRTSDGAVTWQIIYTPPDSVQHLAWPNTGKIQFVDDSLGYAALGENGYILKTLDRGNTWFNVNVGDTTIYVTSIHMINADTGIAVGDQGKISRTVNGGVTWSTPSQISSTAPDLLDVIFFNDTIGYAVGGIDYYSWPSPNPDRGVIYGTTDGGVTWIRTDSLAKHWLTAMWKANDTTGYAVGWNGYILKISNPSQYMGLQAESQTESGVTIFPNPFSESATVTLTNYDRNEKQMLQLYDVTGRIVQSIPMENGMYVLQKDNLLAGIYCWHITSNGAMIDSGKLVVE
jgi:photosystem II stability/assembly factor-like uncharacterized protein